MRSKKTEIESDSYSYKPLLATLDSISESGNEVIDNSDDIIEILNSMPTGIIIIDDSTEILDCNLTALNILEFEKEKFVAQNFENCLDEDDKLLFQKNLIDLINSGKLRRELYSTCEINGHNKIIEIEGRSFKPQNNDEQFFILNINEPSTSSSREKSISRERKYFESMLDNLPVAIVLLHAENAITYSNKEFTNLTGYKKEDIDSFETWFNCFYPDPEYQKLVMDEWQADLKHYDENLIIAKEFFIQTKHNEKKLIHFTALKFSDAEFLLVMADKTLEYENQNILRASESLYRAFADATFEGIFINKGKSCIACNSQAVEMFGYDSKAEMISHSLFDGIADESIETVKEHFYSGSEEPYEIVAKRKDGSKFSALVVGKSAKYEDQDVRISIVRNIEREKEAIRELQIREEELLVAQRITHLGNWTVEVPSLKINFSDEIYNIFDLDKDNIDELTLEFVSSFIEKSQQPIFFKRAQEMLSVCQNAEEFYNVITVKGNKKYIYVKGQQERDEEGNLKRVYGIMHDITNIKTIEDEKKELEARIQEAQKRESLSVLAGGIAHDFNNLLAGILGNVNLAYLELSKFSPAYENLKDIEKAVRKAADLTRKMLAYSGHGRFVITTFDLNELIREMLPALRNSVKENIKISIDTKPDSLFVKGDISLFRQLLTNMIENSGEAIDFPDGRIQISVSFKHCDSKELSKSAVNSNIEPGDYIILEIKDNGEGISKKNLKRIFDPFFSTRFTGRGLGLAAVAGIVEGHKGYISVKSKEDKGTTFKIYMAQQKEVMQGVESKKKTQKIESEKKILIIEDENYILSLSRRALTYFGLDVTGVTNFLEAEALLNRNPDEFQIIILDTTLPQTNYKEAFKQIRAFSPSVIVIFASDFMDEDDQSELESSSYTGFIQKPYKPQYLIDCVKKYL